MSALPAALACLLKKASMGRVTKKFVSKVEEAYNNAKASGTTEKTELEAVAQAYETVKTAYDQKVFSDAYHIQKVRDLTARLDASTADSYWKLSSLVIHDENTGLKHGFQGISADAAIRSRSAYYGSFLVDPINKLNLKQIDERELIEHLFFKLRGAGGAESKDQAVIQAAKAIEDVFTLGGNDYAKHGGRIQLRKDAVLGAQHNPADMLKMGKERWIEEIFPLLDMRPLDDLGVVASNRKKFLGQAFDSLTNGGLSKMSDYVADGLRSVANRRNHHRILQLKDAASWVKYNELSGRMGFANHLENYASNIGRDVGLLETLGPKPEAFFRSALNHVRQSGTLTAAQEKTLRNEFNLITGSWDTPLSPRIARFMANQKSLASAALLGAGTVVDAAIGDGIGLSIIPKLIRGLPVLQAWEQQLKYLFKSGITARNAELARLGWGMEEFVDSARGLLAKVDATNASAWAASISRFMYKVNGLTRVTTSSRQGNKLSSSQLLFNLADGTVDDWTKSFLNSVGVGEAELKLAKAYSIENTSFKGLNTVDLQAMISDGHLEAATKIGQALYRTAEISSPSRNARIQAKIEAVKRSGTSGQIVGESFGSFSSYLASFWDSHFRVMWHLPSKLQQAAMLANLTIILPTMYTIAQLIRDTISGKEPELNQDTIMKGFARSNMLPILGDYLFTAGNSMKGDLTDRLAGLQLQAVNSLGRAGSKGMQGEFGDAAQEVAGYLKTLVPGGASWGVGLMFQRTVADQFNLLVRGDKAAKQFHRKIKEAAENGNDYWWKPGEVLPEFLKR